MAVGYPFPAYSIKRRIDDPYRATYNMRQSLHCDAILFDMLYTGEAGCTGEPIRNRVQSAIAYGPAEAIFEEIRETMDSQKTTNIIDLPAVRQIVVRANVRAGIGLGGDLANCQADLNKWKDRYYSLYNIAKITGKI